MNVCIQTKHQSCMDNLCYLNFCNPMNYSLFDVSLAQNLVHLIKKSFEDR